MAAPWEYVDRQLHAFRGLLEQQQRFLAETHEHVRAQQVAGPVNGALPGPGAVRGSSKVTPPGPLGPCKVSGAATPPGPSGLFRGSTASGLPGVLAEEFAVAKSWTSRRGDSGALPVPSVYLHGNSPSQSAVLSATSSANVPDIHKGFVPWAKARLERVVSSPFFEPTMGCVIAANALNIGVAIDLELRGKDTGTVEALETLFLVIFSLELMLRAGARGWRSLMTGAGKLDTFLIVLALLTELIRPSLDPGMSVGTALDQMLILRIARLLRLARSARLIASLESLWKLAHGLVRSCTTMGSACLLMFTTLYLFACFGAELIAKPNLKDPAVGEILQKSFSTMPKILLTLSQFVSMDSTAAFYYPLVEHTPFLAVYFACLVAMVPIAMLNLITAVLVEDVISAVQADEEMKSIHRRRQFKQLKPALRDLFHAFDTSHDGYIQIQEVSRAIRDGLKIPESLQAFLDPARMLDLFDAIDADNSGDLDEQEFIDGLTYAALSDVAIETIQMLHLLRSLKQDVRRTKKRLGSVAHPERPHCTTTTATPEMEANPTAYDSEGALAI